MATSRRRKAQDEPMFRPLTDPDEIKSLLVRELSLTTVDYLSLSGSVPGREDEKVEVAAAFRAAVAAIELFTSHLSVTLDTLSVLQERRDGQ